MLTSIIPPLVTVWIASQVILDSRHFEESFHRDRVRLLTEDTLSVMVPREMLQKLADWSSHSTNSLLWLQGEPSRIEDLDNPLSLVAAQLILILERTKLPVVSYFCELRRGTRLRLGNTTIEQQEMIALGYAIARQMIELLLPEFSSIVDLSDARLAFLDGTVGSWQNLLGLLKDLVPLLPDTVYLIIDGMHWLNDRTTDTMAAQFVASLRECTSHLRVLFTTNGRSDGLLYNLDTNETMRVDDDMLQGYGIVLSHMNTLSTNL